MSDTILEVIACTLDDAVEAERGGADRLEVISRFDLGGMTPSPELVRQIKARVSLPLRVMVRASEGYGTSGVAEIERLCDTARLFDDIGVDGLVLGFLKDRVIDIDVTAKILACAPNVKATFHHAFEDAREQISSIRELKTLPQIDRILAHGGRGSRTERISRLARYAEAAHPEIRILAGGGLDGPFISQILATTSIGEIHVGTAARTDGAVDRSRVATLVDLLDRVAKSRRRIRATPRN